MTKTPLPWWLILILILEILPMFAGPYAAINLPRFLGGPEAETLNQATFIYSNRNIAVGVALIVAVLLRSVPMLFGLILVRLITDLGDLPTLLHFDLITNVPLVVGIFVFLYYIPAVIALVYLWKQMTERGADPA